MFGTISRVFVEVLRNGNLVPDERLYSDIVLLNNEYSMIVNTQFPIIGVFVSSSSSNDWGYVGTLQGFNCIVQLVVITPFDNPAASSDDDVQYDYIDLSGKVIRYIAKAKREGAFKELSDKYGFSFVFSGIDADSPRYKTNKQEYEVVQHNLVYTGKGFMLDLDKDINQTAPIEQIDINCQCGDVKADELPPIDPNHATTWR